MNLDELLPMAPPALRAALTPEEIFLVVQHDVLARTVDQELERPTLDTTRLIEVTVRFQGARDEIKARGLREKVRKAMDGTG